VEINRSLYLNEVEVTPIPEGVVRLQATIAELRTVMEDVLAKDHK
jgi:hypothetical protein